MENLHCANSEKAIKIIENEEAVEKMAVFFKAFSEPIRIKILLSMLEGEICVHDLARLLNVSQPRISNQLRLLKDKHLIKSRKEKNHIFYSLDDEHIKDILNIGACHIKHTEN